VKDTRKPNLILGACHTVLRREADILAEPIIVYNTSHIIEGTTLISSCVVPYKCGVQMCLTIRICICILFHIQVDPI
jgi:hypothetical protein